MKLEVRGCLPPSIAALLVLGLGVMFVPAHADAHRSSSRTIGLGVTLGEPTGLSLDIRPSHSSSLELAIGWDTIDQDEGHLDDGYVHLEYVVRPFVLAHSGRLAVPFYLGIGAFLLEHGSWNEDDLHLGARVPFGIAFEFRAPVQIFLEVALRFFLIDDHGAHDDLDLGGALGFRVYF
ncbi:MAG: hypothetical protein HY698_04465 [Deltaproteobacteria bacterium]|nr:hypothetical protein [Deltaproteobacteria bacterium]